LQPGRHRPVTEALRVSAVVKELLSPRQQERAMIEDRDVEIPHEVSSFVAELRRLADALEQGEAFTIHIDGEEVTIPEGAEFSVAHEREDGEVELEFQVTWSLTDEEDEDEPEDDDTEARQPA
jgi:amphi-Trp domain-containing protein